MTVAAAGRAAAGLFAPCRFRPPLILWLWGVAMFLQPDRVCLARAGRAAGRS